MKDKLIIENMAEAFLQKTGSKIILDSVMYSKMKRWGINMENFEESQLIPLSINPTQ